MKILHIITDLGRGGAETMLNRLSSSLKNHKHIIITLGKKKEMDTALIKKKIKVINLDLGFNFIFFFKLKKLYKLINEINPNVVQTWLAPSDLIGGLVSFYAGKKNIVWSIRHSNLDEYLSLRGKILIKILSLLSYKIPQKIISNSVSGKNYFIKKGYCREKIEVIPNGINLDFYKENQKIKEILRDRLKIKKKDILIGSVGRYIKLKNYELFIKISKYLSSKNKNFKFVLIGDSMNNLNTELIEKLKKNNILEKFYLLGEQKNINKYYNILDFYIHTSKTEGFSNAIAESMASSVITFGTDAGDSKKILKNKYFLINERNYKIAANKIFNISKLKKEKLNTLKKSMREKIIRNFNIEKIKKLYQKIYFSTKPVLLLEDLKKAKINLNLPNRNIFEPGNRRRIIYYLNKKKLNYNISKYEKNSNLIYFNQYSDLSSINFYRDKFYIFDFVDSYLFIPIFDFKNILRGLGKFVFGSHSKLQINFRETLINNCKKADLVICATDEQKKIISKFNNKVFPILDFNDKYFREQKKNFNIKKKIKISWEGLPENIVQLKEIKSSLSKLSKEFKIELVVITDSYYYKFLRSIIKIDTKKYLQKILGDEIQFRHVEWKIDTYFKEIINTDFVVIPINLNDKLVAGKPENKLLHLWKLKMPVITSETSAYKRTMNKAGLNHYAKNDNNFYKLCKRFIQNKNLRIINAKKGYNYSLKEFSNNKIMKNWDEALKISSLRG